MADEAHEPSLAERILSFAGDNSQFILKEDEAAKPDAAASQDIAQGADLEGNQGDTAEDGLDTASDEDDLPAEEEEGEADETDQKDEEGKGLKKKTFKERMDEMREEMRAELCAEMEAKFQQAQQKPPEPDFFEPDEDKINAWFEEQNAKISEAELDGKHFLAEKLKRDKIALLDQLEENDRKREAWQKQQEAQNVGTAESDRILQGLDQAASFFRAEMKIEPEVWNKMSAFFAAECEKSPLLGRKFAEKAKLYGPIEAVEWAHKYTLDHMGKEAKAATEKREQTKTRTAAVSAAQTATVAPVDLKTIKATYDANPSEENFARYMEAKRKQKAA